MPRIPRFIPTDLSLEELAEGRMYRDELMGQFARLFAEEPDISEALSLMLRQEPAAVREALADADDEIIRLVASMVQTTMASVFIDHAQAQAN